MADDASFENKVINLIFQSTPNRFKRPLTMETNLQRDLGLDSIAITALVFQLEQLFNVDISNVDFSELGQMKTVGDAVAASKKILDLASAAGAPVRT